MRSYFLQKEVKKSEIAARVGLRKREKINLGLEAYYEIFPPLKIFLNIEVSPLLLLFLSMNVSSCYTG